MFISAHVYNVRPHMMLTCVGNRISLTDSLWYEFDVILMCIHEHVRHLPPPPPLPLSPVLSPI